MTAAITPPTGSTQLTAARNRRALRLIEGGSDPVAHNSAMLASLRAVASLPAAAPVISAEPPTLATVHRLPVRPNASLYLRRRLMVVTVIAALVLGFWSMASQPTNSASAINAQESITVVVEPGDTLWGIATSLNPNGNTRALVSQLTDLAGSASLQPGQMLEIPGAWLN